jgi:hypothetical protein
VAQFGRAGRLGRSGCRFKSCHLDMAKYSEGAEVRLKRRLSFNTTHLKPNSRGKITKVVKKKAFGNTEYAVSFYNVGFDITVTEKDLDALSPGVGQGS